MKSPIIALFLGATSAVKLNDAPPYFNEPTWNEKHQSAAGFVQINDADPAFNEPTWNEKHQSAAGFVQLGDAPPAFNEPVWNEKHQSAAGFLQTSACVEFGAQGVPCVPNAELFADGMEGAESLDQNIKMKEETFSTLNQQHSMVQTGDAPPYFNEPTWNEKHQSAAGFLQFADGISEQEAVDMTNQGKWNPVVVDTPYEKLPPCHGTNGGEGVNCKMEACTGTNGPKDGPVGTPCKTADAPAYSNDKATVTGNLTPTNSTLIQIREPDSDFPETDDGKTPLKLSILETTKGSHSATFY